jgi:UDP-2,3-diacylglucosamine pyrophosphatase LpxH
MKWFDAVIVSDLHLGAPNSRTADFLAFLDCIQTRQLILNGDVFDDPKLNRMDSGDLRVLDALRQFERSTDVVWLRGNHDPDSARARAVLGFDLQDETVIDVGESPYLVYHGHGWDASMNLPAWMIKVADSAYYLSQWVDPSHQLARTLKRRCKKFCKSIDQLQQQALHHARRRSVAGVILGHTHVAKDVKIGGVHYLNSGCWTEQPSSFIGVKDGVARRIYWDSLRRRQTVARVAGTQRVPEFRGLLAPG